MLQQHYKKSLVVFIINLVILFAGFGGYTQTIKPPTNKKMDIIADQFAREILRALKNNNELLWESLHPTNEEYKALLQLMLIAKAEGLTQEKIDDMMIRRKNEATAAYKKEFRSFCEGSKKAGVSWTDISYQSFDCEAVYPDNFTKKYLLGDIWLISKDCRYVIEGVQAVEVDNGYKLQEPGTIRKVQDE